MTKRIPKRQRFFFYVIWNQLVPRRRRLIREFDRCESKVCGIVVPFRSLDAVDRSGSPTTFTYFPPYRFRTVRNFRGGNSIPKVTRPRRNFSARGQSRCSRDRCVLHLRHPAKLRFNFADTRQAREQFLEHTTRTLAQPPVVYARGAS